MCMELVIFDLTHVDVDHYATRVNVFFFSIHYWRKSGILGPLFLNSPSICRPILISTVFFLKNELEPVVSDFIFVRANPYTTCVHTVKKRITIKINVLSSHR